MAETFRLASERGRETLRCYSLAGALDISDARGALLTRRQQPSTRTVAAPHAPGGSGLTAPGAARGAASRPGGSGLTRWDAVPAPVVIVRSG